MYWAKPKEPTQFGSVSGSEIQNLPFVLYLCIGQNLKNQPNLVLYLVPRYKIFVSVATLALYLKVIIVLKAGFTESLSSFFMRTDFDAFTVKELHAEAAYAELLMMKAMLSLIEEETFVSLVRGMLKIRSAYQIIK